jgi:hypothetical protein
MEFGRYHPKVTPKVDTVLRDYQCMVLPNDTHTAFIGHSANVKCVHFVGEEVSSSLIPRFIPQPSCFPIGPLHSIRLLG